MSDLFQSVLVTGGAGFIGSRLVAAIAPRAGRVTVLDNLLAQVHGIEARQPAFAPNVEFIHCDIRDAGRLTEIVARTQPTLVYHLAAETGTGQSYDEIVRYTDVNVGGTARLIEALRMAPCRVRRVVLSGSRAIYGEGAYLDQNSTIVVPEPRTPEKMKLRHFWPECADGTSLTPIPTPETATPKPASVYASTKLMQELLLAQGFEGTGITTTVLRFQNVFGPGQSLRNPYTGVISVFASQAAAGNVLNIFEDGLISRDFVFVDDVVSALVMAAETPASGHSIVNIGAGTATTILDMARKLLALLGRSQESLRISGDFRIGDVRHAVADIRRAEALLNWKPVVGFDEGLGRFVAWTRELGGLQARIKSS
jgi:dTDP-L-rhamnose 4-epimerase